MTDTPTLSNAEPVPIYATAYCWSNFVKVVFYGYVSWPSSSYWFVPGTCTDIERAGWRE